MTALLRRLCERRARENHGRAALLRLVSWTLTGPDHDEARELADVFEARAEKWQRWAGWWTR